jgi:hypothetical protein
VPGIGGSKIECARRKLETTDPEAEAGLLWKRKEYHKRYQAVEAEIGSESIGIN